VQQVALSPGRRPVRRSLTGALCEGPPLEKKRYTVKHAGATWEIDEFLGAIAGLVIAEIELQR